MSLYRAYFVPGNVDPSGTSFTDDIYNPKPPKPRKVCCNFRNSKGGYSKTIWCYAGKSAKSCCNAKWYIGRKRVLSYAREGSCDKPFGPTDPGDQPFVLDALEVCQDLFGGPPDPADFVCPVASIPAKAAAKCARPSITACKRALRKVYEKVGKRPKQKPGKFGSPQRGDKFGGYRLDPPHPPNEAMGHAPGSDGCKWHFDWWDYPSGKRKGAGSTSGKIPIE